MLNVKAAQESGEKMAKVKVAHKMFRKGRYKFQYTDNPYRGLTGSFYKQLKAAWHNSFNKVRRELDAS